MEIKIADLLMNYIISVSIENTKMSLDFWDAFSDIS